MGENVRELTPLEKENAALKARIEELEKKLSKVEEDISRIQCWYEDERSLNISLKGKINGLKEVIIAQAISLRDEMERVGRL